jgi:S-DNA-T family DNA segregation ATPase FtsK/SpoIIIE
VQQWLLQQLQVCTTGLLQHRGHAAASGPAHRAPVPAGVPVGTTGNVIYTTQGPMYGSSQTQPPQAQYQYPQQAPSAAYPPQAAYAPQAAYETPGAFPQQAAYPPQAAYPQQAAYPPAGGYPKN